MRKANQETFADLSAAEYFKTNEEAEKQVKEIYEFPAVLEFDDLTGGFIALHKNHCHSALRDEIPVCLLLKNFGFGVILLDETAGAIVPDAMILARYFEIKRMSKAKNLNGAVHEHFRKTYRKAANLVLHVDQWVHLDSLRTAVMMATKFHPDIKSVWVIYQNRIWQLNRKVILMGRFQFH